MKIVFTDLDGTLLDHDSYSFKEADESLSFLKRGKIPIIINTSKTRTEVESLRKELDIEDSPFIVENGAGIYFPKEYNLTEFPFQNGFYVCQIGITYDEILEFIKSVENRFSITGFSQMNVEEVVKLTGLDSNEAKMAKARDFTEPFILKNENELESLKQEASKQEIEITKGGRFYHFISKKQGKGKALLKAKETIENRLNKKVETVALGDGKNDFSMLNVSDYPVLIPTFEGRYENQEVKNHIKAPFPGPKGWNAVIKELFHV